MFDLTYDGTYEGLLSAIFEGFRSKLTIRRIVPEQDYQTGFFDEPLHVATRPEWADRVRRGVERKTGRGGPKLLYRCFLSEQPDVELLILHFVQRAMAESTSVLEDYRDARILKLHQLDKKMGREIHRMHAFVRFQRTRDDIYTALIEPDFNVLPLIGDHFEKRYPAMDWLIYDTRRHYGLFHESSGSRFVTFPERDHLSLRQLKKELLEHEEVDYQSLWRTYFHSVNIPERNNEKLHLQHVPRRYWKYLTEKGGG